MYKNIKYIMYYIIHNRLSIHKYIYKYIIFKHAIKLSLLRNRKLPQEIFYVSVIRIAALSFSGAPNAYVQD